MVVHNPSIVPSKMSFFKDGSDKSQQDQPAMVCCKITVRWDVYCRPSSSQATSALALGSGLRASQDMLNCGFATAGLSVWWHRCYSIVMPPWVIQRGAPSGKSSSGMLWWEKYMLWNASTDLPCAGVVSGVSRAVRFRGHQGNVENSRRRWEPKHQPWLYLWLPWRTSHP